MAYDVRTADRAIRDAEEYYAYIRENSHDSHAADAWWSGLFSAIETLEQLPARCPLIPEHSDLRRPIHHLIYESHRILFEIVDKTVRVYRVYPAAARPLRSLDQQPQPGKPGRSS